MNFFVDNNLSPALAAALNGYLRKKKKGKVVHLRAKFKPNTRDEEWIKELANEKKDWIVITADINITSNKGHMEVWRESKLKGFFLNKSFLRHELHIVVSKVFRLLKCMEEKISESGSKPFQIQLPATGKKLKDL